MNHYYYSKEDRKIILKLEKEYLMPLLRSSSFLASFKDNLLFILILIILPRVTPITKKKSRDTI